MTACCAAARIPCIILDTSLAEAELDRLNNILRSHTAMDISMLDGYLAAVSSGPNLAMPDQVLRWAWSAGRADDLATDLIIWHSQAVNEALNDQNFFPLLADPQAWCRGYLAGFASDMTAWAPLTAAQPGLLKVIMAGADSAALADAARRIHAFWLAQRQIGVDGGALQGLLAALTPGHAAQLNQRLH